MIKLHVACTKVAACKLHTLLLLLWEHANCYYEDANCTHSYCDNESMGWLLWERGMVIMRAWANYYKSTDWLLWERGLINVKITSWLLWKRGLVVMRAWAGYYESMGWLLWERGLLMRGAAPPSALKQWEAITQRRNTEAITQRP